MAGLVLHIGPDQNTVGGTQSVIRMFERFSLGADRVVAIPTWSGAAHGTNSRLVAKAAAALFRAPSDTVVHVHISSGGAWLRDGVLIRVALARGLAVVVTLHGASISAQLAAHPELLGRTLRGVRAIICLSPSTQARVQELLPDAIVEVVPNPVEIVLSDQPARMTQPVVLFAGENCVRKGADVLVQAWQKLLDQDVPGECRVVGPPSDFTFPSLPRLTVDGPLTPGDAVRAAILSSRVVALPSRHEGMPMILTEALACARPFVATPVGGTALITPDPRMLVPVADADALANALARYLTDPLEAESAGRAGQEYVTKTRGPEVIDARFREIYANCR